MARQDDYEVTVGDTVLEYGGDSRRQPTEGKVIKIGSTLVHVEASYGRVTKYRRDGQGLASGYSGHFQTLQQRVNSDRERVAREAIRQHGLEISLRANPRWTVDQLEQLAEAVRHIRGLAE